MGKCTFNKSSVTDEKYCKWLAIDHSNKYAANCKVYERKLQLGTVGVKALDSHMQSLKHKTNMKTFVKKTDNPIINYVNVDAVTIVANSAASKTNLCQAFSSSETLKAEVTWTLQTVARHQSYKSNDDIVSLFAIMFPDSEIAQAFSCSEYKTAYLVKFGLAPFINKLLIERASKLSASELDERALDALKEFNADDAIKVLKEFSSSNLEHVTNKSAWLCGQMKTYRQKRQAGGAASLAKGPDEAKLKEILDRTGYSLDVTTGQRKYGGPPPECDETQPGTGHEIFCGKIPKDIFEDELIPLFEKCGKIWDLRLMMDPLTGLNRGYCFVTFCEIAGAKEAVKQLDNYEIRKGKTLKVNVSVANVRLFVGNIPKNKTREEIKDEFGKRTEGLMDVIIYGSADNPKLKNRGFSFLEFDSHKSASTAKRKLSSGRVKVWGCDIIVDWADPQEEPDEETMSKVKVLYVRNLNADITEETLKEKFEQFGKVERVKKIKDYGFVHFEERDDAVKAMEAMNGEKLGSLEIEVSLAKPPTDNKKKEQRKRDTVRVPRGGYPGWDDYWGPPMGRMPLGPPGRGMRRPMPPPRGFGGDPYYDDYYGYDDFDYYGGYAPPPPRARGRGGPPPPVAMRGRGAPPRGGPRGGPGARGGPGRGLRGARGGPMPRGRGASPLRPPRGGKRKAGADLSQGQTKRRNLESWGNQPIPQQPLGSYGGGYANDSEWYQDSYGQNWG